MPTLCDQRDLPYSPQQLFDLVADVERYPEFLPHVMAVRICRHTGNCLTVDQVFRVKMLRFRFMTEAFLQPPNHLHVHCADGPFGTFAQDWRFTANPAGGSILNCDTTYDIRSVLLRTTLEGAFGTLTHATLHAFSLRAAQLYGTSSVSAPQLTKG